MAEEKQNEDRCTAHMFFGRCVGDAVADVVMGCKHEHERDGRLCRRCLADAANAICWECWDGPARHECELHIVAVTSR